MTKSDSSILILSQILFLYYIIHKLF